MFGIPVPILWLALVIVFAVTEAATMGLTSIWFSVGALAAMLAALLHAPVWLQIVLFLAVSGVAVWCTRDLAKKHFNKNREKTNADRIVGMQGVVLETIDDTHAAGSIQVNGAVWTARSIDGTVIPKDAVVLVREISGVKAMVELKTK